MTKTVDLHTAKAHLDEIILGMEPGCEIVITEGSRPLARLLPVEQPTQGRKPGLGRGEVWVSDGFDAPCCGELT